MLVGPKPVIALPQTSTMDIFRSTTYNNCQTKSNISTNQESRDTSNLNNGRVTINWDTKRHPCSGLLFDNSWATLTKHIMSSEKESRSRIVGEGDDHFG